MQRKIIIDTDPGIDDAMAILFAHMSPELSIQALTTIMGNASLEGTTRNALYLVQRFGINAPVYAGAALPLELPEADPPDFVHGADGLGNISADTPTLNAQDLPAEAYLRQACANDPGEVTIVALGRLTNLALALQNDSDFASNVGNVVIMGGALGREGHGGNVTPCAEANILGDPHAADVVFQSALPMTMVGLDVTMKTTMDESYMKAIRDSGGEIGQFIYEISRFYDAFHRDTLGMSAFPVHDASAIAYALSPNLFQTETGTLRAVTDGIALGQTIFSADHASYSPGHWDDLPQKQVCVDVDPDGVLKLFRRTICAA